MTTFEVVRLVGTRELRERVRSKAFALSTGISLVFLLAISILPGLFADDRPTTYDVGVVGVGAEELAGRLPAVAEAADDNVAVDVRRLGDAAEADRLVAAGDLDAAVVDGRIVVDEKMGDRLGPLLQEANRQLEGEAALSGAGVSGEVAGRVLRPEPMTVRVLDPPAEHQSEREGLVFVGTLLLYGQLLGFGYWVASGVVEEKSSRVVELLLAKARPSQLLSGKILGIGVLGFVQLVAFVVIGLVAASVTGSVELPPETVRVTIEVLAWYLLGFGFYSCLFAVSGALASRAEELQSTTTPLMILTMASLFAATAAGADPTGTVAQVATFVPFSAPMVLPMRSAAGAISGPTMALSVAIVLVFTVGAVALASRAYAGGALHLRGQLRLRAALSAGRVTPTTPPTNQPA